MKKINNIIVLSILLLSSINASIIVSQYIETNSGSDPKGIELWNVSGATIDFSSTNLEVKKGTNGAAPSTDYSLTSGTLINGGVIVVGVGSDLSTTTTNNGGTFYSESFTFNGDDALEIYLGGTLTDMFGVSNSDPGNSWDGSGVSTRNQNIQLIAGVVAGDTDGWTDPSTRFETVSSTPVSDQTGFGKPPGVLISGNAGFRMLSAPVSDGTYTDLLSELWTQGMTGSDAAEASGDNVWTWAVGSGGAGSWTVVSNLGNTMTAGEGILAFVFADNNNDGTDDLPVTLSVSGSESSGDVRYPAIGSIEDTRYGFSGNPYYQTIDYDNVARTNVSATVYIHDDAKSGGAGYISWNGSSGDVTNGLIAPFQGFVVTASGGAGYITIQTADKSSTAGAFFRTLDGASDGSSYLEFTTAEGGYSKSWVSFRQDGEVGQDDRDANRLMPLMASSRLVSLTHNGENSLDINNVPFDHEGTISIPLDVMSLTLEEENYVTGTSEVSMSWNLDDLPEHIDLTLVDNLTGEMVYLNNEMSHSFTIEPKGSFSATYEEAVGIYPLLGDARFSVQVSYGVLDNAPVKVIPKDYALSPVYPNPFNPSATVRFDVPEVSRVELQVYDVTGKLVETLLNERMTAGQYQYTWQPQELATGTYFLRLITANQTFTQKVTYVK
ncbi:MAG: hypothetical protein CMG23_00750 [Candidatus Marinimicrobia bacterium]|nr:hypothetical protein [Candidatus Neomarinimicrobiota bacterium]